MSDAMEWIDPNVYADDYEYFDVPTGMVYRGRKDLERFQKEMEDSMGDRPEVRVIESIQTDKCNVSWVEWSGAFTTDLGKHAVKGKRFTVQGLTLMIKDDEGKIVKHIDSWDLGGQLAQLGVLPSWNDIITGKD